VRLFRLGQFKKKLSRRKEGEKKEQREETPFGQQTRTGGTRSELCSQRVRCKGPNQCFTKIFAVSREGREKKKKRRKEYIDEPEKEKKKKIPTHTLITIHLRGNTLV